MSVGKTTEMCVYVYICGKGPSLRGFAKPLQSSYREEPMPHTYTCMHILVFLPTDMGDASLE